MIEHVIDVAKKISSEIILSTSNSASYAKFGYPILQDSIVNIGPIGGIYSCLAHSKTQYNLFLTCDSPFVNKEVLLKLIAGIEPDYKAIYLQDKDHTYPLTAIYSKDTIGSIAQLIENKDFKMRNLFPLINSKAISLSKEESLKLVNLNTPEDLKNKI
jgi:molybdopterin-guanine dinucleotide biosynthesis protein A